MTNHHEGQSALLDIADDWIFGPLNLIDRAERWITAARFQDAGYQIAIPRTDKGGEHSLDEASLLLKGYGIAVYGRTHDARNMYFHVKKRQARWAEYLLTHAGYEMLNAAYDERNAGYAAGKPAGWMPTAWADKPKTKRKRKAKPKPKSKTVRFLDKLDAIME